MAQLGSRHWGVALVQQQAQLPTNGADTGAPDRIDLSDVTDNSPVSIQLGYGLIEMVDEETGGPLVNRITSIRKQISRNLGLLFQRSSTR